MTATRETGPPERRRVLSSVAVLALGTGFVLGTACGPGDGQGQGGSATQAPTGTIVGRVRLTEGVPVPPPRVIANTTDPEICGESHTLADTRIDTETRGLADVIVSLTGEAIDAGPTEPDDATLVLDNRDCRFDPHVAVTRVGTLLEAVNSDAVLHTTHLYGPREWNVSLPIEGARQTRELTEPGLFVVKCDIHGWMEAYLRVDGHPFHDVTNGEGAFRIEGVPPGRFGLELWHERLGTMETEVEVASGSTTTLDLSFTKEN